jgi:hypothetical protein
MKDEKNNIKKQTNKLTILQIVFFICSNMIGSGLLNLPCLLGSIGSISIISCLVTGLGSLSLAFVFIEIANRLEKNEEQSLFNLMQWNKYSPEGTNTALFGLAFYVIGLFIGNTSFFFLIKRNFMVLFGYEIANWITFFIFLAINFVYFFKENYITEIFPMISLTIKSFILGSALFMIFFKEIAIFEIFNEERFNLTGLDNYSAFLKGSATCVFAFLGLESGLSLSKNAESKESLNSALKYGVIITSLFSSFLVTLMFSYFTGQELALSSNPYADLLGGLGKYLIIVASITTGITSLSAWMLICNIQMKSIDHYSKININNHNEHFFKIFTSITHFLIFLFTIGINEIKDINNTLTNVYLCASSGYLVCYFLCLFNHIYNTVRDFQQNQFRISSVISGLASTCFIYGIASGINNLIYIYMIYIFLIFFFYFLFNVCKNYFVTNKILF